MNTYARPPFDALVAWGMGTLILIVTAAWLAQLIQHKKRLVMPAALCIMALVVTALAGDRLGIFSRIDLTPAPFGVIGIGVLVVVVLFGLSQASLPLVQGLTIERLVALQAFRLPLELIMLRAALLEIMPIEFSMQGYNLDVLTGCGALGLWFYMHHHKTVPLLAVHIWNVLGMVFLLVIAALAVMTSPFLKTFGDAPQHINTWILFFPYSLLPWVLVSAAVLGHMLLTRKLFL